MTNSTMSLRINLDDSVDEEELDHLTRQVLKEISELDVESAVLPQDSPLPAEVVKGDPITIGSLVVSLASAGVFTALIELLKSWALRREGRVVTIKAVAGDRNIELTYSPTETTEKEMAAFVQAIMKTMRQ